MSTNNATHYIDDIFKGGKVDTRSTTNEGGGTIKFYFELIFDNSTDFKIIDLRAIIEEGNDL